MLREISFILILLSFLNLSKGQNTPALREIAWKQNRPFFNPYSEEEETTNILLLYFEKAVYQHEHHNLPFYSELFQTSQVNSEIIIGDMVFEDLKGEDLKNVSGLSFVNQEIKVFNKKRYIRKKEYIEISFVPVRKNPQTGQFEKLVKFSLVFSQKKEATTKVSKIKEYANNSVLSAGTWLKIKINKSGIYKISFTDLQRLGIQNPDKVRIFGNGGKMLSFYNDGSAVDDLRENKILIANNAVYFYGEGPVEWKREALSGFYTHQKHLYSEYAWYFISSDYDSQLNNIIVSEDQTPSPPTHDVSTFTDFAFHEIDSVNLIGSGRLWVGEKFDFTNEYTYKFSFPGIVNNSVIVAETSLLARSPASSSFSVEINNQSFNTSFAPVNYNYTSTYATHKKDRFTVITGAGNEATIKIRYNKGSASSEGWLDYVSLNVQRLLTADNKQLKFRNMESVGPGNISSFTITQAGNQAQVWDITNIYEPRRINASPNGNQLSFKVATDSLREFIVFDESNVYTPFLSGDGVGLVENQNIHGLGTVDMFILCHEDFYEHALMLKQIHEEHDGMSVEVIKNQQVYNEFSSGAPDVSAIRNLLKMFYDKAANQSEMPKLLCLFGDGSYDNRRQTNQNTNFILTYQSENSLSPTQSFVTDDFFGMLDDGEGGHDGDLDIGVGRIPVKSKTEALHAINKIRSYLDISSNGNWRNNLCFIADDEDYNTHIAQADELSRIVENNYPVFNLEKIYLDAYVQQSTSSGQRYPDVNRAIDNSIEKGMLLTNYTGHGNERWLAEENILSVDQLQKYQNKNRLTVFMTATCEFSRFDNYTRTTAGEHAFLNPNGAAIALFTTTRLVYASPNFELNKNFYNYIFEKNSLTDNAYTLGEVMMHTKNASGSGINKRNFTLLGDPALKLSYAPLAVRTNSISNATTNLPADTLKAHQKITIKGEIQDGSGIKLSNYNGTVFPVVYDKKQNIKTLDNDGEGPFNYSIRNSIIFKGKASVSNGDFQFSFIVPKDIRYQLDTGKISYYSANNQLFSDAKGFDKKFIIGGVSNDEPGDEQGPDIKMYLNSENFVNGGISGRTPELLVYLSDSGGINTTGSGIGHDIVATLDNKNDKKYVLNDFYESDLDDFSKGKIIYKLPELEPGEHTIHLKAWDVFNNSSQDSLFFRVVDSENLVIRNVLNYPNPFSTNTSFFFEHNRPGELLEVSIHIFSVSGKIIKSIHEYELSEGYRSKGIKWEGRDDFGNKPGRGVYFYRISVRTAQGEKAEKFEKLLILN